MLELKIITLDNGTDAVSVAEFNNGSSHIICDDHCWVIVNHYSKRGYAYTHHVFPEAMKYLKMLPDDPYTYPPLRWAYTGKGYEQLEMERDVREIMES